MSNRILLVDDEETIRYALKETLISEGYSVDVAKDGFRALERIKLTPYDLLITDIRMHGMDGLRLIREMKKNNLNLKVIIITAYGSLETVKEATRLGVGEFISKPFKIQEIKDIITRILCGSSSEGEEGNIKQSQVVKNKGLADNLLSPAGLSYHFTGPASQPKSTVVFDFVAINSNKASFIFGNINSQDGNHREWWENKQIEIMIKTLFRSKMRNTPKKIISDINNFLYENVRPGVKGSMLCAHIDRRKKIINYVNYGDNLVCSVFMPNGQVDMMKPFPCLLGALLGAFPKIETVERSIPYSSENKLVLSVSNTISEILEKGAIIQQRIEDILHTVKKLQKKQSKGVDLYSKYAIRKDINFDDETVLLMNLDWDYVSRLKQSKKCGFYNEN